MRVTIKPKVNAVSMAEVPVNRIFRQVDDTQLFIRTPEGAVSLHSATTYSAHQFTKTYLVVIIEEAVVRDV